MKAKTITFICTIALLSSFGVNAKTNVKIEPIAINPVITLNTPHISVSFNTAKNALQNYKQNIYRQSNYKQSTAKRNVTKQRVVVVDKSNKGRDVKVVRTTTKVTKKGR